MRTCKQGSELFLSLRNHYGTLVIKQHMHKNRKDICQKIVSFQIQVSPSGKFMNQNKLIYLHSCSKSDSENDWCNQTPNCKVLPQKFDLVCGCIFQLNLLSISMCILAKLLWIWWQNITNLLVLLLSLRMNSQSKNF